MRTYSVGVVSSNHPARVPMKIPLARKEMENHLISPTSLDEIQSPVSGFCYARNRVCNAVSVCNGYYSTL